jgi:hypothetical protein
LEELSEKYDLYLITSRPISDIEITKNYIDNTFWNNYFKDIIFTHKYNNDKKCELSKKLWFDIVIDDAAHHNWYEVNF